MLKTFNFKEKTTNEQFMERVVNTTGNKTLFQKLKKRAKNPKNFELRTEEFKVEKIVKESKIINQLKGMLNRGIETTDINKGYLPSYNSKFANLLKDKKSKKNEIFTKEKIDYSKGDRNI